MIHERIPEVAAVFLAEQPFFVLGGASTDERVWATLVTGPPGFLVAETPRRLRIASAVAEDDPLRSGLEAGHAIGGLAIELSSRRRMRLNGRPSLDREGLTVEVREVFSNCPKYIQARVAKPHAGEPAEPRRSQALLANHERWIETADILFIASLHGARGADVSHRGGRPGFVRILDDRTLVFPDYAGNNLFQTLGNLSLDPRVGLLFLDLERGGLLHLTGRASIDWQAEGGDAFEGVGRTVRVRVDLVVERPGALGLAFEPGEASPFNPP